MRYLLTFLITLFILSGCGSSVPVLKPYKLDIQQGNLVTSKMLLQLKPGMTKSQVRYIMGTPLIVDSFHKDRWDYFYQMRQGGKIIEQRRVILDFEKDLLAKVRGDVVPQGSAGAVSGDVTTGAKTTAELLKEKQEDKGLLERFKFWKKDETPAEATTEAPKAAAQAAEPVKPKETEKSWTEKLKFWKKDETPVTKPVEAPKEVVNAPVAPAAPETAAEAPSQSVDTPSVLAVPIGADVLTAPVADTPKQAEPEPVTAAPEPVKSAPPPEPVKPAPATPEPPKVVVPAPVQTPVPAKAATGKHDEKMIFRMDRTLKQELLEQQATPAASEPVAEKPVEKPIEKPVEKVAKPKKKAVEEPLPEETEPGFFDRMLEKIGF